MDKNKRDLDRLRQAVREVAHEDVEERNRLEEERRIIIREQAEHVNRCSPLYDELPPFVVTEFGNVYASRDGKPVTDGRMILAESFYWMFVNEDNNPKGLIHDEEGFAFYMPEPPYELAFSRDVCHLSRLFWALGDAEDRLDDDE